MSGDIHLTVPLVPKCSGHGHAKRRIDGNRETKVGKEGFAVIGYQDIGLHHDHVK